MFSSHTYNISFCFIGDLIFQWIKQNDQRVNQFWSPVDRFAGVLTLPNRKNVLNAQLMSVFDIHSLMKCLGKLIQCFGFTWTFLRNVTGPFITHSSRAYLHRIPSFNCLFYLENKREPPQIWLVFTWMLRILLSLTLLFFSYLHC